MNTDVLIVGAGPSGLMLANQLARRGIRTLIIDRHSGPARETRALGVQARTLEIYSRLGVVDRALALGKRGTGANLWGNGRKLARVPLGSAGQHATAYPFILILGQDDNERILGERLSDWGMSVQWNTELVGLEQQADRVVATLDYPDGSRSAVSAAWVAGCDGAHSSVRELNQIGFPGAAYEHIFYVADTVVTGSMVADEVNVYLWREGFHLFFPMRGEDHWRIVGILPEALRGRKDVRFEDVLPSLHREGGTGLDFKACSWFSTYRIHHRSAAQFRERRCFLLGDAAHIHSPVGAQGMNTGLQDAYNLGWKLALVVNGQAGADLLDSYEQERLPVARRLLNTTDRAFKLVVSDNWLAGVLRSRILARIASLAMNFARIQQFAFRVVAQIGIHYRDSSLSVSEPGYPAAAPQAGDRFPWLLIHFEADGPGEDLYTKLDDTCLTLLVFGQSSFAVEVLGMHELLRIILVPAIPENDLPLKRASLPRTAYYLLRPDGHIGLCGIQLDVDTIRHYMMETLKISSAATT